MKPNEKNLLLDDLSICYNRINYLKVLCEEQGRADEVVQLERRKARLKLEIDGLLRDLFQDWIGDAKDLKGKLNESNDAVDKAIKNIERELKTAQNITKAIGYIDDAIKIAADLVT